MTLIELIVLLPFLGVVAIALGAPARFAALGSAFLTAASTLIAAARFNPNLEGRFQMISSHPLFDPSGFPKLGLAFGIDGVSLVLLILTALVLLAAIWIAPEEKQITKGNPRLYYICCLLIGEGAIGAFSSTDLFFLYAFHELALIPTFLMIGIFGHGRDRVRTAWTITIYLGVGSLILLIGLLMAVWNLGGNSFDISDLIARARDSRTCIGTPLQNYIYLLLLIGFGILVSLFPFHSWAPPAYAKAPTPVAMLHAGVLKKFGLYGLIRVALPLAPQGAEALANVVLVMLLGNIIVIGLITIAQKELDRMLGYSSVMHMGYVFLGIASGTRLGLMGAVVLMFAHGISIALLFALAGALRDRFGSLAFNKLGGVLKLLPRLGFLFALGAFAAIDLPGFANFASEVMILFGAFQPYPGSGPLGSLQWTAIISVWGVVISAVYMLRAYRNVFQGSLPEELQSAAPVKFSRKDLVPSLILLVPLIAVGLAPELLLQFLRSALGGISLIAGG